MIVKIHSRGAGSGSGPVDYLLGKDRQREQARVLRGNPEHVRELIDGCDFARAYTSGVLSFQEPDIADAEKSRLMDEWEHTLLTGLGWGYSGTYCVTLFICLNLYPLHNRVIRIFINGSNTK